MTAPIETPPAQRQGEKKLILHIEVPGIYVDDLPGHVASVMDDGEAPTPTDYADVLIGEWLQPEVAVTLLTRPVDGNFDLGAFNGLVVGMEIRDKEDGS